jgi:IS5 family transposase
VRGRRRPTSRPASVSGALAAGNRNAPLTAQWHTINRARSRIRARVEHAFHVVKRLWGFTKVRYRGWAKNTARAFTLFALSNRYLLRHRLRPAGT